MPNSRLGLDDLVSRRNTGQEASGLMNVKVPSALLARIGALAATLRATRTDVVVAVLNEGLDKTETELKGWKGARTGQRAARSFRFASVLPVPLAVTVPLLRPVFRFRRRRRKPKQRRKP
jgi:hypothetical protein